jgi:hypothetical protein
MRGLTEDQLCFGSRSSGSSQSSQDVATVVFLERGLLATAKERGSLLDLTVAISSHVPDGLSSKFQVSIWSLARATKRNARGNPGLDS